jgi:predicted Zn-dependent peptidase
MSQGLHHFLGATGLSVWVLPTPGFARFHAALTFPFGALDLRYQRDGREVVVPPGIAHFLEHQMFNAGAGSIMAEFARLGASANAFTGNDQTTFLFSTTDHFGECLALLSSFLRRPVLDDASVEKERAVIEQEICMYEDMPEVRGALNLREALYSEHPLRYDVGGSVDSIRQVDAAMLQEVYDTFYHPARAVLFVAGDLEPGAVIRQVDAIPGGEWGKLPAIERHRYHEPEDTRLPLVEVRLPASLPLVQVGFKDSFSPMPGREVVRRELLADLVHYSLFGRTSDFYWELYERGLTGNMFSASYEAGPDYGLTVVAGETPDPFGLADQVLRAVEHAHAHGLSEEALERGKRRMLGSLVSMFNHGDSVGQTVVSQLLQDLEPLEILDLAAAVTPEAANQLLTGFMQVRHHAVSIVWPDGPTVTEPTG